MKCLRPLLSKKAGGYVPCGKCYFCLKRKRLEWQTRLLLERSTYSCGYFVTLTYNDEHLPDNKGVSYKHARSFLESFRRNFPYEYSYYLMSEYGGRSKRPHYHAHFLCDVDLPTFRSYVLRFWDKGFIKIGRTTLKSIKYVCKFHLLPKEHVKEVYPVPNFHIVTRGLGSRWFDKFGQYHIENELRYVRFQGFKYFLPTYLSRKCGFSADLSSLNLWQFRHDFLDHQRKLGFFGQDAFDIYDRYCLDLDDKLLINGVSQKI